MNGGGRKGYACVEVNQYGNLELGMFVGRGMADTRMRSLFCDIAGKLGCKRLVSVDHPIGRLFLIRLGFSYAGDWYYEVD